MFKPYNTVSFVNDKFTSGETEVSSKTMDFQLQKMRPGLGLLI